MARAVVSQSVMVQMTATGTHFFTQLSQEKEPEEEDNDQGEELDHDHRKSKLTKMLICIPRRGTIIS